MSLERLAGSAISGLDDVHEFEKALADAPGSRYGPLGACFDAGRPILVVRAPARLDCMGGIADYSGATVCELPLDRAVILAIQERHDRMIVMHSHGIDRDGLCPDVEYSLDTLTDRDHPISYEEARQRVSKSLATAWAGYVAGAFAVLVREGKVERFPHGATIVLVSDIPLGAGISSSAAVEVAAMSGVNLLYRVGLDGFEIARLAQIVENRVVGAPCGIMDQVTSALGQSGRLLCLRCQPHEIQEHLPLPDDFQIIGINSKVKHHVGGAQYTSVRVGAFMGLTMILAHLRSMGAIGPDDDPFGGYLCNIPPQEFETAYRQILPKEITGQEFLTAYGGTMDPVTTVDPTRSYMVRSRVEHPIYEHERVRAFILDLQAARRTRNPRFLQMAGRLMYASDWSYTRRCRLGSPETAWIVRAVRELGEPAGFYGAKITGGGSGGTVAVAGHPRMCEHLDRLLARYTDETGITPDVFTGTSPGALQFGHCMYVKR